MVTELNKQEIYAFLQKKLDFNTLYALAEVGKELTAAGYGCRRYGFARMKNLMKELSDFIQMEDYEFDGHSNTNIILTEWKKTSPMSSNINVWASTAAERAEVENETGAGLLYIHRKKLTKATKENRAQVKLNKVKKNPQEKKSVNLLEMEKTLNTKKEDTVYEKGRVGEFMRFAYLPPKIIELLKKKGLRNPERVLASAYQHALCHSLIHTEHDRIEFPVKCGEENLLAVLKKNDKPNGREWYLSFVGPQNREISVEDEKEDDLSIPPGKSLEQFADLGGWQDFLSQLARLALPEKWDSEGKPRGNLFVLKKYVQYTFYRLLQEDKICVSQDKKFAAFNTGLVNHHYDDVYACFVPNLKTGKAPWRFETFAIAGIRGKDGYGKLLTNYFNPLPQVPSYVENKEDLIYDLDKELLTDYEHIIVDNLRRLPKGFLLESCYGDAQASRMIHKLEQKAKGSEEQKQAYLELSKYIAEHDKIFRRMRSRMEDAIQIALKRVRWNFRTAIPCYFPKGNCMSLMLPLCLEDDSKTDAALVVQKNPSGSYQGQTVLHLEQAYLDARLICRPNMDWLKNETNGIE